METPKKNTGKGAGIVNSNKEATTMARRSEVEAIVRDGIRECGIGVLQSYARDLGIKGFSKYTLDTKDELADIIEEFCADVQVDEVDEPVLDLEAEAKAFIAKSSYKDVAMGIVKGVEKVYSKAKNPISENDSKIRLLGLAPDMVKVEGIEYFAVYNALGEYMYADFRKKEIEVAVPSPFADWAVAKKIKVVTITSEYAHEYAEKPKDEWANPDVPEQELYEVTKRPDPEIKLWLYQDAQKVAFEKKEMFGIGNGKKGEPLMGFATRAQWMELTGDDIFSHDNPNKPIGVFMGPAGYQVTRVDNSQWMRVRCINDEYIPKKVISNPTGKKLEFGGHPLNDGNLITSSSIFYTQVGEKRRAAKDQAEYIDKINKGQQARKPKPAKESRVSQAQVRNYYKASAEYEALTKELHEIDPSYVVYKEGDVHAGLKVKMHAHTERFNSIADKYDYPLTAQDAFVGLGNWKTQKGSLKHGDIVLVPIKSFRFINVKVSDGKSSLGVQCVRLNPELTRALIDSALPKADNVIGALMGDAESYLSILKSDAEASMDDAVSEPLRSLACATLCKETNAWLMPMYKSRYNVVLARVWTYLVQHVYKVRLSDYAFYLECNEDLDRLEQEHYAATGELKYFFNAPTKKKLMDDNRDNKFWNIGRNPIVGPGNFMGFVLNDYNGTSDVVEVSCRALWTMFGDVDGDTCVIFPHNEIEFPVVERPLDSNGIKPPKKEYTPAEFSWQCVTALQQILKSAADTGALDNLSRQIIFERMEAGDPMTAKEIMKMGVVVQQAIDGMKHADQGAEEDAAGYIKRKFGVNGTVKKIKATVHQYKALRKDGGDSGKSGLPRQSMEQICRELQQVEDLPLSAYNNMLNKLKVAKPVMREKDSMTMQTWCKEEWDYIISVHMANRVPGVAADHHFGWTYKDISSIADTLLFGTEGLKDGFIGSGLQIRGYQKATRALSRRDDLKRDKVLRRKTWTKLAKKYQEYIEMAAQAWTCNHPEKHQSAAAAEFKYQLMVCIGTKNFGVSESIDQYTREPTLNSRAGALFWIFPKFDCVLRFVKKVNPDNPYLEIVEQAVKDNMAKQLEREAMELKKRVEEQQLV